MDTIKNTCIGIEQHDDGSWSVVTFEVSSNDPTIYSSGNWGIQIAGDGSQFEVGKEYDLNLNAVSE